MKSAPLVNLHCHTTPGADIVSILSVEPGAKHPETKRISIGLHPWRLNNWQKRLAIIEEAAAKGELSAIGECGLDRVRSSDDFTTQQKVFELQVNLAEKYSLPLIIHCVRAVPEIISVKNKYPGIKHWIMHGFNSKPQLLADLLEHGFYISYGPDARSELILQTPIERMFLETDASGEDIAKHYFRVAQILQTDLSKLRRKLYDNFQLIFS